MTAPSGTTPLVANRHSAISSLRASATTMTFRMRVPLRRRAHDTRRTVSGARLVALPEPSQFNHYRS